MIKLVIFDLDGTLVNAYPAIIKSVNATLNHVGLPPEKPLVIKRAVGHGDRHLMVNFVGEELADKALRFYRRQHLKDLKTGVNYLPQALEILRWSKSRGLLTAIASNRPTRFTQTIIKGLKAKKLFDVILCADKAKKPKPAPDMLWEIGKKLNIQRKETLFVGDMTIDIACGQRAKIKTIAVCTGSNTKKELKAAGAYKIINRLNQLKKQIESC